MADEQKNHQQTKPLSYSGWDAFFDSILGMLGLAVGAYGFYKGYIWGGTCVAIASLILTSLKLR